MFLKNNKKEIKNITGMHCFLEFKKSIEISKAFLSSLSKQISDKPIICYSHTKAYILDDIFLVSTINTLNSITMCSSYGGFSDANVLIRKYRDDLFLYLFIIEVLNNRKGLTEEEISAITGNEFNVDNWLKVVELSASIIVNDNRKDINDKAVDAWFDNTACSGQFKRELSIENYIKYLKRNPVINKSITKHGLNPIWEDIRKKLNNYTHNNGREFLIHNSQVHSNENISKYLLSLSQDISFITSVFLVILILIKPDISAASDYADYLTVGLEPPDDSQYWVAPFITEYINQVVIKLHPELKLFLKDNNKYRMQIE